MNEVLAVMKKFLLSQRLAQTLLTCLIGLLTCLFSGLTGSGSFASEPPEAVDFNRDVRAILSDKCFLCHGPDEQTREAGLRLDNRDDAVDSAAIAPGTPDESELMARILSDDPDLVMPPPSTGKAITPAEAEILKAWIAQDAPYDSHWAFSPPTMPTIPVDQSDNWSRTDVDRFARSHWTQHKLSPSVLADPATLVRRLSLDLTGLPPSIELLRRFDRKWEPAQLHVALDGLVDELLQSPHFGERWARWWLDSARYADSSGYEKDMPREVWFYRDWVIASMNNDKPYNQFIVEQIAGDLLALENRNLQSAQDQRVATGFLRHSMTNEEGGADPEQFRVEAMFDRMDAIGKAILGITTQCAQCHTHKYDPLSHEDYYSMFATMNDFHEACITVYTPEQARQRDEIHLAIGNIESKLRSQNTDWKTTVSRWADSITATQPLWHDVKPTEHPYEGQKFNILPDGSILSESYAPTKADNSFSLVTEVGTITAVRLDALQHPKLPRGGPGRSIEGTGALTEFYLTVAPEKEGSTPIEVKFIRAISDVNPVRRDLKPFYRDRNPDADDRVTGPASYAIDGDLKTAWTTDNGPGRSNQARHIIFVAETPVVVNGPAKLTFRVVQKHGGWNSDDNQNFLIGRYRFSITDGATIPETTIDSVAEKVLSVSPSDRTEEQWLRLFSAYRAANPDFATANEQIETLWQKFPVTTSQLIAQPREQALPTYILSRGDFLSPTDPVQPNVPAFLNPLPKTGEPDRLRFARWMVADDAPTTARVVVNRIWQAYFGRGLVNTPEDFGYQSAPPSHPELLDYLAVELMENDWSLKHIHRLIATSAVYRQTSNAPPAAWLNDPENEHLSRGPRIRVEAEMVRDIALAASGLLNKNVGGPSIYPEAPRFLFEPPTSYGPKIWNTDVDGMQYRRSLYVHQYRSIPYPPLQVFDAPKGDAACVRRLRSNTPLQALVLLNEPQYVDAARAMATRIIREVESSDDTDRERIKIAFQLATSRLPDDVEIKTLLTLLNGQRQQLSSTSNEELSLLIGVPVDLTIQLTGVDAVELGSWMTVCRVLLNLDETITKS